MRSGSAVGIVLCAGASERWGGRPKALLDIGGEPALARVVRRLASAGVSEVRVVTGAHDALIRSGLDPSVARALRWVVNPTPSRGRTGSIQCALADLPAPTNVVLWPVDQPLAGDGTLPTLLRALEGDPLAVWVIPEFAGRGGHPVVLAPPALRAIGELRPSAPLRSLLPQLGPQVRRVSVDDPGVVVNLNTPAEYLEAGRAGMLAPERPWTET